MEVTVIVTPGEPPRVRLTQLAFGPGVGWYAQHSVDLALSEAHGLAALLEKAPRATAAAEASAAPVTLQEYRERRADPVVAREPRSGVARAVPD